MIRALFFAFSINFRLRFKAVHRYLNFVGIIRLNPMKRIEDNNVLCTL